MRCLGVLLLSAFSAWAQEPLPIKSASLAGKTYTLSGRHKLAKGVKLTLGKGVKVIGQGKGGAIELEGALEVAGELGEEVVFENVWVILGWKFDRLRIVHAKFLGLGGLFVERKEQTRGKAFLEHVAFSGDARVWVTIHEGGLELRNVTSQSTCFVAATASDCNVKLDISRCGFLTRGLAGVVQGGLRVYHVKEVRMTNTQVDGVSARFTGGAKLTIEGCRFDAKGFHLKQAQKGRIGKTKIARCDFASHVIEFEGPRGGRERVTLKECHFHGDATSTPKDILQKRITAKDVQVVVKSPSPTPHNLAGPDKPK